MKISALRLTLAAAAAILLSGCAGQSSRNTPVVIFTDMDYQGRYEPQGEGRYFSDRRASRRPVPGTIAVGQLNQDESFYTGLVSNQYVGKNPVTIDMEVMRTGQRRFNTYCSPCHDRTGTGRGLVGQRAVWIPTNLHEDRVRAFNDGEIYHVITNGRRSMPSYRHQIVPEDRWAIVAYLRALQRAKAGTVEDVPADLRSDLR